MAKQCTAPHAMEKLRFLKLNLNFLNFSGFSLIFLVKFLELNFIILKFSGISSIFFVPEAEF